MKNTPKQGVKNSRFNAAKTTVPAKKLTASPRAKTPSKKGSGSHAESDIVGEREESSQAGAFQVYLNQIGTTPLLSRQEEVALAGRIRAGFEALLQHLLPSGRVGDILLERARLEMSRANCGPARRQALTAALNRAGEVLQNAREQYLKGPADHTELNAGVAAAFGELVAVLELWPDQCLELLGRLEREMSCVFTKGSTLQEAALQREFERQCLMDGATCGTFLAGARRLRAAAVAARNEMVGANLRLVVATARKIKQTSLSFEDLVQEGNRGLLTAAERFDERLGNRFSTFATHLIKSAMRRESDNQGRTIRLPVHRCEALRKLDGARTQIESEFHRSATVEQLSEQTGFSCSEVRELSVLKQGPVSLDQKAGDEGEEKFGDFLPDPASLTPFYGESEPAGVLDPYLEHLTVEQRAVVRHVYGIGGCPLLSMKETAERLGFEQAEVRHLHQSALAALRNAIPTQRGLHGYACAA
jgi:RNA polymerase primary sigma factor